MEISVLNNNIIKESESVNKLKQATFRASSSNTLERTPQKDDYNKKDTSKTIGIIAGFIAAAALIFGGVCYHYGKPAEQESKKIIDCLKDGWEKIFGQNKEKEIETTINEINNNIREKTEQVRKETEEIIKNGTEKAENTVRPKAKKPVKEEAAKGSDWLRNFEECFSTKKASEKTENVINPKADKPQVVTNPKQGVKKPTIINDSDIREIKYEPEKSSSAIHQDTIPNIEKPIIYTDARGIKIECKPTDKPIMNFLNPDGEACMAREVTIGGDYTCIAVSSKKNPNETMLMNREEFDKLAENFTFID